jgi:hypothetical protein
MMTWFKIQKNIRVEYRPPHKKNSRQSACGWKFWSRGCALVDLQNTPTHLKHSVLLADEESIASAKTRPTHQNRFFSKKK